MESCAERIQYGLTAAQIDAYETPVYNQIDVNTDLLNDRWYVRVNDRLDIFDGPNGAVIRSLDAGFNFLTVLGEEGEWTQINPGEWVKTSDIETSNAVISEFTGFFLEGAFPEYPLAWLLVNAHPSSEPGGNPVDSNPMLYRYTRVHVFDSVEIDGWRWYQVGANQWLHQTNLAKVIPVERPSEVETDQWVSIDLYEQTLTVYDDEAPIFVTLISTGLPRWPTYEGVFNIYFRQTRRNMSWGTPGDDFYFLEEVPWTMFFDEGRALHGAYWHDGLGYRRSHGCVNMSITDANWLYNWVAEKMGSLRSVDVEPDGLNVYVWSSDIYR